MTDTERGTVRFAFLMRKYIGVWIDVIKRIIYRDEFESLTEYNGFLTGE